MLDVAIPGSGRLRLADLVCDFGTLAVAGNSRRRSRTAAKLAALLRIRVVAGDTFDGACGARGLALCHRRTRGGRPGRGEGALRGWTVAGGRGRQQRNDRLLLLERLAIGVGGREGVASRRCGRVTSSFGSASASICCSTKRLVATLRS
jgi:hypothetical protein